MILKISMVARMSSRGFRFNTRMSARFPASSVPASLPFPHDSMPQLVADRLWQAERHGTIHIVGVDPIELGKILARSLELRGDGGIQEHLVRHHLLNDGSKLVGIELIPALHRTAFADAVNDRWGRSGLDETKQVNLHIETCIDDFIRPQ